MDLNYTNEEKAFREEVRVFLAEKLPKEVSDKVRAGQSLGKDGHDWWHAYRVWQLAKHLQAKEGGNLLTIELTALLHDVADYKVVEDVKKAEKEMIEFLKNKKVEQNRIDHIMQIHEEMSFHKNQLPSTLEGKIVQDADRLDAIGAIGIGRAFAFGGNKKRLMHNPEEKAVPGRILYFR